MTDAGPSNKVCHRFFSLIFVSSRHSAEPHIDDRRCALGSLNTPSLCTPPPKSVTLACDPRCQPVEHTHLLEGHGAHRAVFCRCEAELPGARTHEVVRQLFKEWGEIEHSASSPTYNCWYSPTFLLFHSMSP